MSGPWTDAEIQLLGTKPDADVGRLIRRPGKAVWAKRHSLGIADPPSLVRLWTDDEDKVVLNQPVAEAAKTLHRTVEAVKIRLGRLRRKLGTVRPPQLLTLEEAKLRIEVPRYDSKEQQEKCRLVGGPYAPPSIAIGGWLKCELRGELQVGGYTNALIPWPAAMGHASQRIVCGDLVRALKTESLAAVCFHFGVCHSVVSEYRQKLGIERLTPGSLRLFRRTIDRARTPEARAKISQSHGGARGHHDPGGAGEVARDSTASQAGGVEGEDGRTLAAADRAFRPAGAVDGGGVGDDRHAAGSGSSQVAEPVTVSREGEEIPIA